MSMSIYIAHVAKSASNALSVLSTDQKDTSSVYDENSQFACPAHAEGRPGWVGLGSWLNTKMDYPWMVTRLGTNPAQWWYVNVHYKQNLQCLWLWSGVKLNSSFDVQNTSDWGWWYVCWNSVTMLGASAKYLDVLQERAAAPGQLAACLRHFL